MKRQPDVRRISADRFYSRADKITRIPLRASRWRLCPNILCRVSLKRGAELALSLRYLSGRFAPVSAGTAFLSFSIAAVYSKAWTVSFFVLTSAEDTPTDGITVSAIASKVVHWESVRGWPIGGAGNGLSRGAILDNC